ncbi:MAG: hypothetical protein NTX25_11695 [Proteobacteria bacterium]|nr:hypothetical protein [Pseudomonadota bacterium]
MVNDLSVETAETGDRVKILVLDLYTHHEAGLDLKLKNMSIYLLNQADFGLSPAQFDPKLHEHSIPKFEMARIYLLVCALTHDELGFQPTDRDDSASQFYEMAYHRCLKLESDPERIKRVFRIAQPCGFEAKID